jgi:hypothetical protein
MEKSVSKDVYNEYFQREKVDVKTHIYLHRDLKTRNFIKIL